jgi:hypothetical protein
MPPMPPGGRDPITLIVPRGQWPPPIKQGFPPNGLPPFRTSKRHSLIFASGTRPIGSRPPPCSRGSSRKNRELAHSGHCRSLGCGNPGRPRLELGLHLLSDILSSDRPAVIRPARRAMSSAVPGPARRAMSPAIPGPACRAMSPAIPGPACRAMSPANPGPACRDVVTCRARTDLPRCCHLPVHRPACRTALKRMN